MKAAVKVRWLEALRSGRYQQGRERLRNKHSEYCCLGVLCDLYAAEHPEAAWHQDSPGRAHLFTTGGFSGLGFPPDAVLNWAELSQPLALTLVPLNDGERRRHFDASDEPSEVVTVEPHTFAQIADHIEAQV